MFHYGASFKREKKSVRELRNSIIIGAGPSGYTAAVYLARAELNPLLLSGERVGGQLMWTSEVENFPGFREGIAGPKLMGEMREQAVRFGAEIIDKQVTGVDFSGRPFKVFAGEEEYHAKTVIIATGARARMLGVGEERLLGRGVSVCAVCDGAFFKGKETLVVGGGDAALEDALALTKFAKRVTLVHRREALKASKIMQKRVLEEHKDQVRVRWNAAVVGVAGEQKLEGVVLTDLKTGEKETLKADGLFMAIGHRPETELFAGKLKLNRKGYLVTGLTGSRKEAAEKIWLEAYPTMTSVEGVFGAGDVVDFRYRQAITAAGFGCMAALDAEKFLTGTSQSW